MEGKIIRRFAALFIIMLFSVILISCRKKDGNNNGTNAEGGMQGSGYTTRKYPGVGSIELKGLSWGNNNVQLSDGKMYSFVDNYDEEADTSVRVVCNDWSGNPVSETEVSVGSGQWQIWHHIDADGNLYLLGFLAHMRDNSPVYESPTLYKYDSKGNRIYARELPQDIDFVRDNMILLEAPVADAAGRIYVPLRSWYKDENGDGIVYLFDEQGGYSGKITCPKEQVSSLVCGSDGNVYAICENTQRENSLCLLDYGKKEVGTRYGNFPAATINTMLNSCGDMKFLCGDSKGLMLYDADTQSSVRLFDWLDVDLLSSDVRAAAAVYDAAGGRTGGASGGASGVASNAGGVSNANGASGGTSGIDAGIIRIIVVDCPFGGGTWTLSAYGEPDKNMAGADGSQGTEPNDGKTVITLATAGLSNYKLDEVIRDFNRQSDKYKVKLVKYMPEGGGSVKDAIQKAQLAITASDDCPDMLVLDGYYPMEYTFYANLARQGYLMDLSPYLDAADGLSKDEYIESVLNAYTINGKLFAIPRYFSVKFLCGKTSVIGDDTVMSLREFVRLAKEHYDDPEFGADYAMYGLYDMMLSYNSRAFVDKINGVNVVDRQLLTDFLDIVNHYNRMGKTDAYFFSSECVYPDTWRLDRKYLVADWVHYPRDIQLSLDIFGEAVTYVGYPTGNDTADYLIDGQDCIGMLARAKNPDGAWEFMEYYLSRSADDFMSAGGMPSKKADFEAYMQEKLNQEAVFVEINGQMVLQDSGGWGYGDYELKEHILKEKEADIVRMLVDNAGSAFLSCDDTIYNIMFEESTAYYKGDKPLDVVVDIIADRIIIYVDEQE